MKTVIMKSNIVGAACNLLQYYSIPYSKDYVEDFIKNHKDYPSLSSVAALLDDFNIENIPVTISFEQINEVPLPAIAFIDEGKGGNFVLINQKIYDENISYLKADQGTISEPISTFKKKWPGVLLLAQPDSRSQSIANNDVLSKEKKRRTYQHIGIPCLMISFLAVLLAPGFSGSVIPVFLLNAFGAYSSLLLLGKDLGLMSKFSETICNLGGVSKRVGCEKVSGSKAAILFGDFKLSEVGTLFFTGAIIFIMIHLYSSLSLQSLSFLYLLSVLSLPFTVFSIYYQLRVVKQLCPLCMLVVLVLWGQLATFMLTGQSFTDLQQVSIFASAAISFSIPIFFWLSVREKVLEGIQVPFLKNKVKLFTSSAAALNAFMNERKQLLTGELLNTITINPGQEFSITTVLSPFCSPCSFTFRDITKLISNFNYITVNIILFTGDSSSNQFARNVIEMKLIAGDEAALSYLKHWYDESMDMLTPPDISQFPDDMPDKIDAVIEEWTTWLHNNQITVTPTVLINDSLKPTALSFRDLDAYLRSVEKLQTHLN